MSYRKKHIKSKINKIRPKISIFKKLWFWITLLALLIIIFAGYFVLFYPGFQLKNIVVLGNSKVEAKDLQDFVFSHAHSGLINFWNVDVSSASIFLVDDNRINKEILDKFTGIEQVKINKKFPQTLVLGIVERKPVGAYCTAQNKCYLIDSGGVIFEPLRAEPSDITIVRQTLEDKQIFTGEKVIAKNVIDIISKIQKNIKDNFQIDLKEALLSTAVRLNIKTGENWKIYFDLSSSADINSQMTKLNLLMNGGMTANEKKNLQYIDLRPKDRAIVCANATCGT